MPSTFFGQLELAVRIDGTEYPVVANNAIQVVLNQNVRQHLPVVRVTIDDVVNAFSQGQPVNDGSRIEVALSDDSGAGAPSVTYRSFGTPVRQPSMAFPGVSSYTLRGLYDAVPYLRSAPGRAITGTSHDVMDAAAQAMGLRLVSDVSTDDHQAWMPGRMPWSGFVRHVVDHAYVDERSVMAHGIDEKGQLHFHNVTQLVTGGQPKAYVYYGAPQDSGFGGPSYVALEHQGVNRSGYLNSLVGYGQRTVQADASGTPVLASNVDATQVGNSLDIDRSLGTAILPASRMAFAPPRMGTNTHDNYIKARHQNYRLKATYSQNVYFLLCQVADLTLYDMVKFTATDSSGYSDPSVDGTYFVTAKTRVVQGNRYFEKYECCNSGPSDPNAGLE